MTEPSVEAQRAAEKAYPVPYDTSFTGQTSYVEALKRKGYAEGYDAGLAARDPHQVS